MSAWRRPVTLAALVLLAAPAAAHAAPGDHDPAFAGGAPRTVFDLDPDRSRITDGSVVAAGPDGTTYVGGRLSIPRTSDTLLAVGRFSADGAFDPSFGRAGLANLDFDLNSYLSEQPAGLWATAAGGVAIASALPDNRYGVAQLTPAGQRDPGYGTNGLASSTYSGGSDVRVKAAAPGPAGSAFVVGDVFDDAAGGRQGYIGSFDGAGRPAASFPHRAITPAGAGTSTADAVAVDAQGRPVAAGTTTNAIGEPVVYVARWAAGKLDEGFGSTAAGVTRLPVTPPGTRASGIEVTDVIAGAEAITVLGRVYLDGRYVVFLARLSTTGVPVTGFGPDGVRRFPLDAATGAFLEPSSLAAQDDGKVIFAATPHEDDGDEVRIARVTTAGELDPAFGSNGVVSETAAAGDLDAGDLALAGDRLLAAGTSSSESGARQGWLSRFLLDPPPAPVADPGAAPAGGPAGPQPAPVTAPAKAGRAGLAGTTFTVDRRGRVAIGLTCPATGPCAGRIDVVAPTGAIAAVKRKPRKAARFGRKAYAIGAGQRARVRITLSKAARRTVKRKGRLKARLVLTRVGESRSTTKVTLRAAKRKR